MLSEDNMFIASMSGGGAQNFTTTGGMGFAVLQKCGTDVLTKQFINKKKQQSWQREKKLSFLHF